MTRSAGSRLIKNSMFTLLNSFLLFAMTWIVSIWIARQLGPGNYGIFSLVLWLSGTVSWAIGMGFIHAVTKFIAEHEGRGDRTSLTPIVLFVMRIEIVITLIATIICLALCTPIARYFFTPKQSFFFFLAFLGLLPGVVTAIFSAAIEGIQKFEYFTYSSILISPLSMIAKVAALLMGKGIAGLLVVMLVFSFINVIFYFFVLRKEGFFAEGVTRTVSRTLKRRIHKYNSSVMAILLCDKIVWDKSENFFLGRLCTSDQIGFYNLGFNMAKSFMTVLPTTFWRVLFPAMSRYFGSGDREKMKRLFFLTTRYLAFVSFPIAVGGSILSYQILQYLYGRDFIGAQRVLQIIFLSSIIPSLTEPGSAILYGYEKQSFILKFGAVLAVLNVVLDIVFIKRYGAVGAAWCYAVTTLLGSVGGLIYTCHAMKLNYPFLSLLKILFATIIMGIAMEMILLKDGGMLGTSLAVIAGSCVYVVSALVLGTFEEEDYALLESAKKVFPRKSEKAVDWVIGFIAQFKSNGRPHDGTGA